jgi:hypothetical protein
MQTRNNRRAERVWDRLIQSYGTRMAETYGVDIPKPWVDVIDLLTDEQIAYGLKAVIRIQTTFAPTLGEFQKACTDMPMAQAQRGGPTLQEQLCEYAKAKLAGRLIAGTAQYSRPWTYGYREWFDPSRPRGMEKCAECIGIVIELDNGDRLGFSVESMLADTDGHQRAIASFRPGPAPSRAQRDMLKGNVA